MARDPVKPKNIPGNAINEDVRELIHMMMKIRQLEIDLLGTYLREGDYRKAEKMVLGRKALRMSAPAQDVDGGQGRCPTGFREQDGRCVPE